MVNRYRIVAVQDMVVVVSLLVFLFLVKVLGYLVIFFEAILFLLYKEKVSFVNLNSA